jgi:Ca2+-binding RTX toxin-like protein
MSKTKSRFDDWGHQDPHGHDDHQSWDDHGSSSDFDFTTPATFSIDLDGLDLSSFSDITSYDVSRKHVSVTFDDSWTFSIKGSGLEYVLKGGDSLPKVSAGTIDSFTIDGPGKADFSISDLDVSAKTLYNALTSLNVDKVLSLVLGGDETFSGSGYGDYISGRQGNDTIHGNGGADYLLGGDETFSGSGYGDYISGRQGNDTIHGNGGADYLLGGAGADVIDGGAGNDYLVGGTGADTFTFAPKSGTDLIADFNTAVDVIDVSAYGFSGDFEDLISSSSGCGHDDHDDQGHGRHDGWSDHGRQDEDVILDLGDGNRVKLQGVSADELSASNFIL